LRPVDYGKECKEAEKVENVIGRTPGDWGFLVGSNAYGLGGRNSVAVEPDN